MQQRVQDSITAEFEGKGKGKGKRKRKEKEQEKEQEQEKNRKKKRIKYIRRKKGCRFIKYILSSSLFNTNHCKIAETVSMTNHSHHPAQHTFTSTFPPSSKATYHLQRQTFKKSALKAINLQTLLHHFGPVLPFIHSNQSINLVLLSELSHAWPTYIHIRYARSSLHQQSLESNRVL